MTNEILAVAHERNSPPVSSIPMPGSTEGLLPEFVRAAGIEKYAGIKRGQLYVLTNLGLVRSVSLRSPGRRFGSRLWHLQSVLQFLHRRMLEQERLAHSKVFSVKTSESHSGRVPKTRVETGKEVNLLKLKLNIKQQVLAPERMHVANRLVK